MSRVLLLPLLLILLITACDSGDPTSKNVSTADVVGVYSFTDFSFDPNADLISPINLLDTLDTNETKLLLFEDGNFTLIYRVKGTFTKPLRGTFTVNEFEVRLTGPASETDELANLLLETVAVLERDPGDRNLLKANLQDRMVDIGLFLRGYEDTTVKGTISIQLHR